MKKIYRVATHSGKVREISSYKKYQGDSGKLKKISNYRKSQENSGKF